MMSKEQFNSIFSIIVADLIKTIIKEEKLSEEDAIEYLYSSKVYKLLEDEKTKVWQYSTPLLYSLLKSEKKQGVFSLPEV